MEAGHNIALLPCPSIYFHGSSEHARWLYRVVNKNADLINSANTTALNNPITAEQRQSLNNGHDRSGVERKDDTLVMSPAKALTVLSTQPKDRKPRVDVFHIKCPHCSREWLTTNDQVAVHKCIPIIKDIVMPAYEADLQERLELEDASSDEDSTPAIYSSGVTRCKASASLSWNLGQRVSVDDAFWDVPLPKAESASFNTDAKVDDPLWKKAIDLRGRLTAYSLNRTRVKYPYQLLSIEFCRDELVDASSGKLKNPDGFHCETVGSFTDEDNDFVERLKRAEVKKIDENKAAPIYAFGKENDKYMEEQIRNVLRGNNLSFTPPEFSLDDIRTAVDQRLKKGALRPE